MSRESREQLKEPKEKGTEQAESRERLIKSALRLFATRGFDGTTVRDIADDAEVNLSLVSYYFQGKLGLYRTCIEEFGRNRAEKARTLLGHSVDSAEEMRIRLELLIEEIVTYQLDNPHPCQIIMCEIDQGLPHAKDIFENTLLKTFALLVQFFTEAQKKGIVHRSVDPSIVTSYFQGAIFHLARVENVRKKYYNQTIRDPETKKRHIDQLVNLILHGTLA